MKRTGIKSIDLWQRCKSAMARLSGRKAMRVLRKFDRWARRNAL